MRCARKLTFDTIEQAQRTADVVCSFRSGEGTQPVRVYECHVCGHLHFTSKTEAEIGRRSSTVARLTPSPLFEAQAPTPAPPRPDACAGCGEGGAKFEMGGALYHRRCRSEAARKLPAEQYRALLIEWANAGQRRTIERNLAATSPEAQP